MQKFDDYNPQIFYPEDIGDGDNIAVASDDNTGRRASDRKKTAQKKKREERQARVRKKSDKTDKTGTEVSFFRSRTAMVVAGILLAGFAAYLIISFVSYIGSSLKDQSIIYNNSFGTIPEVSNKGGEGGARLSEFLINGGFGLGAAVIIVWLVCLSLNLLIGKPKFKLLNFTIKCLIGFITLSLIVGLLTLGSNSAINWGGYHGRYVNEWIIGFLGWWGAVVLCLVMIAIFVTICMRDIIRWVLAKKAILDAKRKELMEKRAREREKNRELQAMRQREEESRMAEINETKDNDSFAASGDVSFHNASEDGGNDSEKSEIAKETYEYALEDDVITKDSPENATDEASNENNVTTETVGSQEATEGESSTDEPMVVNVNHIALAETHNDYTKKSQYQFPTVSLLKQREERISVNPEEQLENKEKIRKTLMDFGVPIVGIEATVGPTVTLYEVKPDKGHRVSKIKGLVDDISLSLSAIGVRIIAPIPGKGTVGIEVANENPQTVSIRTLLQSRKYQESKAQLPLALGSTISNDVYIADLASMPHLLVAGATGQGKSVGLNVIISSLLFKKRPDELKFVLFDPKMVEFNLYGAIEKQYLAKLPEEEEAIVTEMSKVVPTLTSLCVEMDNRYKLLKAAEVRKLEEYNDLIKKGKLDPAVGHRFMPFIVVVIDEFSDLILTAGKDVEMPITRLTQKARAVGIHVVIATQRPSITVLPGNIKANCPGRIAFKVSQWNDSKVILDATGADQLIGKGDMLIVNNSETVRVQCAFIDTDEVKAICEHISHQPYPADSPYILPPPPSANEGMSEGGSLNPTDRDPLYDEIRTYVITSGVASTSNIQRKYGLGYNRAGRIMDQLEQEGVVGPSQGGKARAVLVNTI